MLEHHGDAATAKEHDHNGAQEKQYVEGQANSHPQPSQRQGKVYNADLCWERDQAPLAHEEHDDLKGAQGDDDVVSRCPSSDRSHNENQADGSKPQEGIFQIKL